MAGEYYKWLARDVQPDAPPPELTRAEKWRNWWHYHKWQVVIAIACVWMVGDFVFGIVDNKRNLPDYCIAYIGETVLPDDTVAAIEEAFAALGEDINGNGKVQVRIQQYNLLPEEITDPQQLEQAAERSYAVAMQIQTNLQTAESVIFLLEDPAAFQAEYEALGEHYLWKNCPELQKLELGNFRLTGLMTPVEGSNQALLGEFTIAQRLFFNNEQSPAIFGANRLFDLLTEGAK